jgi:predicted RNA-binding protein with PIN domain
MMINSNSTFGGSDSTKRRPPRKRKRQSTNCTTTRKSTATTTSTLFLLFVFISCFTSSSLLSRTGSTTTRSEATAFVLYPKLQQQHEKPIIHHLWTVYRTTFAFSRRKSWQASLLVLWMGKGDGKKKRKKKSSSNGSTTASSSTSSSSTSNGAASNPSLSSSSSSSSSQMRVTTNSLVPVRRQLLYAKLNKEFFKRASAGFRQNKPALRTTKYRRTWDDEEIEAKAEERKRKGQDPDWDVILSRSAVQPLVIVDGYNIIYQWKRLKKHMLKGDLSHARQLLVDDLENLRCIKGWRIEVVFDGRKRSTIGPLGHGPSSEVSRSDQLAQASVSKHGVRVVFSGVGIEADTYIESRCVQAKNVTNGSMTGSFIVATDDAMIRLAGSSAGALCMSADRFVNELKAVKQTVSYRVEAAVAKVN